MAAHIDLSWLAQLLTPTPTATQNTAWQPPNSDDAESSSPSTVQQQPFVTPSRWQHLVWGPQSQQIDTLNNQITALPVEEQQQYQTGQNISAENFSRLPKELQGPYANNPTGAAAAGYKPGLTPPELNTMNRSAYGASVGLPATQAATDVNVGQEGLTSSRAALARQPTVEAGITQQSINNLSKLANVDAVTLQTEAENAARAEGRNATYNDYLDAAMKNQLRTQTEVVPPTITGQASEARTQSELAGQREQMLPYLKERQGNELVSGAVESQWAPTMPLFGNRVNLGEGTVSTPSMNPLGANQEIMMMQHLGQLMGKGTVEMTSPSGVKYQVPTSMAPTKPVSALGPEYTPAGGLSARASVNPPLGGGTNNITETANTDHTGSMAPAVPTASSNTTLTPTRNPVNQALVQPSESSFPKTPEGEYDYKKFYQNRQSQSDANDALFKIMNKYDKSLVNGPLTSNLSRQDATDFIARNVGKMSHDDLKQAVDLMHQLADEPESPVGHLLEH